MPELLKQGITTVANTKVSDAAKATGKLVGTAAAEIVLGKGAATAFKGIAFLGKTESGMKLLQQIGGATQKAKEAIGALEIPVKAAEIVLTDGSKMKIPFGETKRLDEIILQMKSSVEKLGMLKGSTAAGKEAIKETAEEGLSKVAQSGVKSLKGELTKEIRQQVKKELVTLNVARTEALARLDELLANGNLSQNARGVVQKARNGIRDYATQDDLIGALRDKLGVAVRESGTGKVFDHLGEVEDHALAPLSKAKEYLLDELKSHSKGSAEYVRLSKDIDAVSEMTRRVNAFLEIK